MEKKEMKASYSSYKAIDAVALDQINKLLFILDIIWEYIRQVLVVDEPILTPFLLISHKY